MRLIAGKFGRRTLKTEARVDYRPTTELARGGIFSMLSSVMALEGARVLDLYAGTGALGFEALSRGARSVHFVDKGKKQVKLLDENTTLLGVGSQVKIFHMDALCFLKQNKLTQGEFMCSSDEGCYDIIFADPPYDSHPGMKLMQAVIHSRKFAKDALIVVESDTSCVFQDTISNEEIAVSFSLIKKKEYGDTRIVLYRNN